MHLEEVARREKRQTFMAAIGIALAVMVLAPPIVQAAAQKVNIVKSITLPVKGTVGVKNGGAIQTRDPGAFGAIPNNAGQFPTKALSTSTIAGGGGLFGVGVCGATTDPDEANDTPDDNRVIVPATTGNSPNIVTGILIGAPSASPATVTVKAPTLPSGNNPIIALRTSTEKPTEFIGLGNGLTVSPSRLVFECPAGTGATYIVTGQ